MKRNENSGCETEVITSKGFKSGKGAEAMKRSPEGITTWRPKKTESYSDSLFMARGALRTAALKEH